MTARRSHGSRRLVLAIGALAFCASHAGAEPSATTGSWRVWNHPKVTRPNFSLTALSDGRILLLGGDELPTASRDPLEHSAEILDPMSGVWSLTDPLPSHAVNAVIVPLAGGRCLLAGGYDHRKLERTQTRLSHGYHPPEISKAMLGAAWTWDRRRGWQATGSMLQPRENGRGGLLPDGRVLVTGGRQATFGPDYIIPTRLTDGRPHILATAELWSPATGRWTAAPAMSQARDGHSMTVLLDGRVLVVGGVPQEEMAGPLPVPAEVWDPASGIWTPLARPRFDREGHTATRLRDGRVLVLGGRTPTRINHTGEDTSLSAAEVWDPRSGRWADVASPSHARSIHDAVLLGDGRVMVAGVPDSAAEIWDPVADRWTSVPLALAVTAGHVRLAALADGRVLLVSAFGVQIWKP